MSTMHHSGSGPLYWTISLITLACWAPPSHSVNPLNVLQPCLIDLLKKETALSPHLLKHLLPDLSPQDDDYDSQQDGNDSHQAANQDPGVAVIHFMSRILA